MKKIIAILLCVALACSAFVIMASAEPVNVALNKSYTGVCMILRQRNCNMWKYRQKQKLQK